MARRKNRKQADETLVDIVEVRDQAQSFIDRNQKVIFGVLTALVVLVGGYFAYNNFYKKPRQQEAVEQMFRAQEQFERDSFALALTNPGGGYMGLLDIIENYKGTKAANIALYYAGISYLNLGKFEAAIDYLKDFKPVGQVTPMMRHGALGDAYSELQDFDQAMSYYKKALNEKANDAITPYFMKKVALLQERNGNTAEALKMYQEIYRDYPNSAVGRDIQKYIARLEGNN